MKFYIFPVFLLLQNGAQYHVSSFVTRLLRSKFLVEPVSILLLSFTLSFPQV